MKRLVAMLVACVAVVGVAAPAAQATFAGANGRLAFTNAETWVEQDGLFVSQLYTVNPDGTQLTKRTSLDGQVTAQWPLWSPSGAKLAYVETSTSHPDEQRLLVMSPDGSDLRGWGGGDLGAVVWSPDSTRIAYTDDDSDGEDVFVTGASSAQLTRGFGYYTSPSWSPDGQWVSYDALNDDDPADNGIFVSRPDGSDRRRLVSDGTTPRWSPEGDAIAFRRADGTYVMRPDGSQITRLTSFVGWPEWSPTGETLALTEYPDWSVWVVKPDGTGRKRVATGARFGGWSPDGKHFALINAADDAVSVADADGSNVRALVGARAALAWSPDSRQLAYPVNSAGGCQIKLSTSDTTNTETIVSALPPCSVNDLDWQTQTSQEDSACQDDACDAAPKPAHEVPTDRAGGATTGTSQAIDSAHTTGGTSLVSPSQHRCPVMGCSSGVTINISALHRKRWRSARSVTACLEGQCQRFSAKRTVVRIQHPKLSGPGPVRVRFIVRDQDGHVLMRAERRLRLQQVQPNGPDCPPTCWSRTVRLDPLHHRLINT